MEQAILASIRDLENNNEDEDENENEDEDENENEDIKNELDNQSVD